MYLSVEIYMMLHIKQYISVLKCYILTKYKVLVEMCVHKYVHVSIDCVHIYILYK